MKNYVHTLHNCAKILQFKYMLQKKKTVHYSIKPLGYVSIQVQSTGDSVLVPMIITKL